MWPEPARWRHLARKWTNQSKYENQAYIQCVVPACSASLVAGTNVSLERSKLPKQRCGNALLIAELARYELAFIHVLNALRHAARTMAPWDVYRRDTKDALIILPQLLHSSYTCMHYICDDNKRSVFIYNIQRSSASIKAKLRLETFIRRQTLHLIIYQCFCIQSSKQSFKVKTDIMQWLSIFNRHHAINRKT